VLNTVLELAGLACLAAFAYIVWPPLVLLCAGLVLILLANGRN
jgi:hypothetical protein